MSRSLQRFSDPGAENTFGGWKTPKMTARKVVGLLRAGDTPTYKVGCESAEDPKV